MITMQKKRYISLVGILFLVLSILLPWKEAKAASLIESDDEVSSGGSTNTVVISSSNGDPNGGTQQIPTAIIADPQADNKSSMVLDQ